MEYAMLTGTAAWACGLLAMLKKQQQEKLLQGDTDKKGQCIRKLSLAPGEFAGRVSVYNYATVHDSPMYVRVGHLAIPLGGGSHMEWQRTGRSTVHNLQAHAVAASALFVAPRDITKEECVLPWKVAHEHVKRYGLNVNDVALSSNTVRIRERVLHGPGTVYAGGKLGQFHLLALSPVKLAAHMHPVRPFVVAGVAFAVVGAWQAGFC